MVKKAIIAAAGRGTRFLPTVKAYPKELVPILEKPIIQYLVEELIGAGVDQIAIVHRHGEPSLKRYFTPDKELEKYLCQTGKSHFLSSLKEIWQKVKILKFIPQPRCLPYGNASPVLAAKSFVGKDSFVFMFGDDLVLEKKPGNYLATLIKIFEKYQPAVVLGVQEVPWKEINRYASIKYIKDKKYPNRAVAVLEKLPAKKAPSNVAQFGRFVVSPKIFSVLAKQKISSGGELWFADTVNTLAAQGVVIAEPIKNGKWLTTGDPLRWLKANIELALVKKEYKKKLRDFLQKEHFTPRRWDAIDTSGKKKI